MTEASVIMDVVEIQKIIPHRYPFLLIDRIVELELNKRVVGIKNVTANEQFFQGHFPGHPVMPGVLIIEAMAQAGGVLSFKSAGAADSLVYFMAIDQAKFRKPVVPGDQIRLVVDVLKIKGRIWKMKGEAFVDGQLVCEAELLATIVERGEKG